MDSLAPIGAKTLEDLTLQEQHDTINPRLNIIFQSESTERIEVELELRGTREVKAGIPCSIGAGRRGFDPRQPPTHEACVLSAVGDLK